MIRFSFTLLILGFKSGMAWRLAFGSSAHSEPVSGVCVSGVCPKNGSAMLQTKGHYQKEECEPTCNGKKNPWTKKCKWQKCKGCSQCTTKPETPECTMEWSYFYYTGCDSDAFSQNQEYFCTWACRYVGDDGEYFYDYDDTGDSVCAVKSCPQCGKCMAP